MLVIAIWLSHLMTPPDFSLSNALVYAVWLLNAAGPAILVIVGVPIGATLIIWIIGAFREYVEPLFR